jgi:hypothetical protein
MNIAGRTGSSLWIGFDDSASILHVIFEKLHLLFAAFHGYPCLSKLMKYLRTAYHVYRSLRIQQSFQGILDVFDRNSEFTPQHGIPICPYTARTVADTGNVEW